MRIWVHELRTELRQTRTPLDYHQKVRAIRPHLLRYGNPAGSLFLEVQNAGGDVIATSEEIDIADIGGHDFLHGYVRFFLDAYLKAGTPYYMALKASGYSFSTSDFIGWVNDYGFRTIQPTYFPNSGGHAPLDMQCWGTKTVARGLG